MRDKIKENLYHSIRIAREELREVRENPMEGSSVLEESLLQIITNLIEVIKLHNEKEVK